MYVFELYNINGDLLVEGYSSLELIKETIEYELGGRALEAFNILLNNDVISRYSRSHIGPGKIRYYKEVAITTITFRMKMGYRPMDDELDRVNCNLAGQPGHIACGWCNTCDKAKFACTCHLKEN